VSPVHVLGHLRDTPEVVIEIAQLPPSMNDIIGQGSRWRYTAEKKRWGKLLKQALLDAGLGSCKRVLVEGQVTFPSRIRHDQGNYRFMLEKALGDALQAAGVLADDDWDSYEFGGLSKSYEKGVRRTRLLLMPEYEEDAESLAPDRDPVAVTSTAGQTHA
jgi:hypothetical protein